MLSLHLIFTGIKSLTGQEVDENYLLIEELFRQEQNTGRKILPIQNESRQG
jgi:hypothetical protein